MPLGGFTEVRQESLAGLLGEVSQELNDRRAEDATGAVGWHNTFEPGKVGTTGSALPLRFLRSVGKVNAADQAKIVSGLVAKQHPSGGWCILSIATTPTVEGTAPTLLALLDVGDPRTVKSINDGTGWLLTTQNQDGGWGSVAGSPSRTCLTASAVQALAMVPIQARAGLDRAVTFLECAQNLDGGWGPKPGQASTVVHTALCVRGLLNTGVSADSQAVQRGLAYIDQSWTPNPIGLHHETYNVPTGQAGHHSKVSLVHDVDAEVVSALVLAESIGLNAKLWQAVNGWLSFGTDGRWWTKLPEDPSLWTIVPRGLAIVELRRRLGTGWTVVRRRSGVVAFSSDERRRPIVSVLWRVLMTWPGSARVVVTSLLAASVGALLLLVLLGTIDWPTFAFGALWPLILAVAIPLATSSDERKR